MKYRTRTFYTDQQKSEMWDRWQRGDSMGSIGRHFNRASGSIFPHLARIRMRGDLSAYNDLLRETYIDIPRLLGPWVYDHICKHKFSLPNFRVNFR